MGIKILKASAGSGKTYQLAYEYIRNVIQTPSLYPHILAVTFTNKATEEMKQRIIGQINSLAGGGNSPYIEQLQADLGLSAQELRRRANEVQTKILHDYSHFNILTIDKFFQRIIRAFLRELGIDANFSLELQTDSILDLATDRLIEEVATDKELKEWVMRFIEERIDDNKKWDIKSEISTLGRELFGERYRSLDQLSPKKEELVNVINSVSIRKSDIIYQMQNIANEALQIIRDRNLTIDDFAYGKGGCVSYFVKISSGVIEGYGKRVTDALESDEKWFAKSSPRRDDIISAVPQLRVLLQALCDTYNQNIFFIKTVDLLQENYRSFALLSDLSRNISQICTEQNILPISETDNIISELIKGNETPFIYEKVGNIYTHFMIDEFQDTSRQQWRNFESLLHNATSQNEGDPVLLVGDLKQSIYRWRGGDWQILSCGVQKSFADVTETTLKTNYRSDRIIVEFNNQIISRCVESGNSSMNERLGEAQESNFISRNVRSELTDMLKNAYADNSQESNKRDQCGYVRVTMQTPTMSSATPQAVLPTRSPELSSITSPCSNDSQSSIIISTIDEIQQRGYELRDIAILVRTNKEGVRVANELLDYKAAHPESPYRYDLVTQEALQIGSSPVVGFIISVLKMATGFPDTIRRAIYNRYLGLELGAELEESEQMFVRSLSLISIEEAIEEVILRYNLGLNSADVAYIQALSEQVHGFANSRISDIALFLKWWDDTGSKQSIYLPQNTNAITIITIHKAKGLQYNCVLIPFCSWSLEPMTKSLVWAAVNPLHRVGDFASIGSVPFRWKNDMGNSYFAEEYYRESVLSMVDNLNTFYVATTRAEKELYIMMPEGKVEQKSISGLIRGAIISDTHRATLGSLEGSVRSDANGTYYEFGTPAQLEYVQAEASMQSEYPSRHIGSRLKFRMQSERYFEAGSNASLSPRSYGIIMHQLFEQIEDRTQIDTQLQKMFNIGSISEIEREHVGLLVNEALSDPLIASWFDGTWSLIRNENDIIVPRDTRIRRPDRVMLRGRQAVVVEYKFGTLRAKQHSGQVAEYLSLITAMGYRDVKGYLWYVEQGVVEEVAIG